MIQFPKQLLLHTLHATGILRLLLDRQRNKVTILMLHGVTDPNAPAAWKPLRQQLTPAQLTQTLTVLAPYYQFVSLSEATEMLSGVRPLIPNSLVLTFDDGYRNNLIFALPVLRKFKAPATIFLSTSNVTEQKPFWFDRLDYAVQSIGNNDEFHNNIPELAELDFSTRENLTRSFITFIRGEKQRFQTDITMRSAMTDLTERLEQHSGRGLADVFASDPWSGILTWDEVKQSASDVHFGSHTVNHAQLALIPLHTVRQELVASREAIEFHTGYPCTHLAYPNGSFNNDVITLTKTCNYSSALTTIPGLNRPGDNLMKLQRLTFPYHKTSAGILAEVAKVHAFSKEKFWKKHAI